MFFRHRKTLEALREVGPRVSDDEFLDVISVGGARRDLALSIRRVLAKLCRVEVEEIRPNVTFGVLCRLMRSGLIRGWDFLSFCLNLEMDLGRPVLLRESDINEFSRKDILVGVWIREVTSRLLQNEGAPQSSK